MYRFLTLSAMLALCLVGLVSPQGPLRADPSVGPTAPTAPPAVVEQPAPTPTTGNSPASHPATDRANPLPGITIDKARRRVMLDCRSLRAGVLLELVGCSPNSREHEALLVVKARPSRVHLALNICGYKEGHPVLWDEENAKNIPATGDPLELQVQWVDPKTGKDKTVPIEDWMAAMDPAKPVPKLTFLFTGSRLFDDGRYLADMEGSVVSITNFPDAVIDLAGTHLHQWAAVEFKGNDQVMPPVDTPCTLIILPPASLRVELDRFGKVLVNGRVVAQNVLPDLLAAHKRARDDARIELTVSPDAIGADVDRLIEQCEKAGFKDKIDRRAPTSQPGAFVFPANDPSAAWDLLTAQWQQDQQTIRENIAAQRNWFGQLKDRRDVLARQYSELTAYLNHAREQYRQGVAQLRSQP